MRSGQAEIRTQLLCSSAASYEAAGAERSGVGGISGIPSLGRRDVQHIDDPAPVSVRGTHPDAHLLRGSPACCMTLRYPAM